MKRSSMMGGVILCLFSGMNVLGGWKEIIEDCHAMGWEGWSTIILWIIFLLLFSARVVKAVIRYAAPDQSENKNELTEELFESAGKFSNISESDSATDKNKSIDIE